MYVSLGDDLALEDMAEQEVVVHGLGDDFGGAGFGKLDKGEVLAGAGLLVATQAQTADVAELRKVLLHLVLVETVGDAADVDDSSLAGGLRGVLELLGDLGDLANILTLLEEGSSLGDLVVLGVQSGGENKSVVVLLSFAVVGLLGRLFNWLFLLGLGLRGLLRLGGGLGGLLLLQRDWRRIFGSCNK